jgi:hypothetical protein
MHNPKISKAVDSERSDCQDTILKTFNQVYKTLPLNVCLFQISDERILVDAGLCC